MTAPRPTTVSSAWLNRTQSELFDVQQASNQFRGGDSAPGRGDQLAVAFSWFSVMGASDELRREQQVYHAGLRLFFG